MPSPDTAPTTATCVRQGARRLFTHWPALLPLPLGLLLLTDVWASPLGLAWLALRLVAWFFLGAALAVIQRTA